MRCPKCGYTSFDHLESCKKCGKELAEFKERFGIQSVLFPGQMNPDGSVVEEEYDTETADAAVEAATGAPAAAVAPQAVEEAATAKSSDSDDFGFDFMGDSADDDDLSFDELFEEAPEDEDIEESIEGPGQQEEAAEEDFSFDLPEEEDDLDSDFGFDPADGDDEVAQEEEGSGTEEDPKSPFDLPESSDDQGAPEKTAADLFAPVDAEQPSVDSQEDVADGPVQETVAEVEAAIAEQERLLPVDDDDEPILDRGDSGAEVIDPGGDAPLVETAEEAVVVAAATAAACIKAAPAVPAPEVDAAVLSGVEETIEPSRASASTLEEEPDSFSPQEEKTPLLGRRVGAFFCDLVVLCLVGGSFIMVAEATMSADSTRLIPSAETLIDLSVPYFLVLFSLAFGYFTLFHFLVGQTPGKMVTGVRVETLDGDALSFADAFLRSVGGLLQALPLGLGYLAVLSNPERRGFNDRLAGTRVINLKDLVEDE